MNKKYKEILILVVSLLTALSLIFNYAGDYYSSVQKTSSDYITFLTVYYTASHLFCDKNYTCTYSNLSFPEFQKKELQKYQDQIDWTGPKAEKWRGVSNQLVWISLLLEVVLIFVILKKENFPSPKFPF